MQQNQCVQTEYYFNIQDFEIDIQHQQENQVSGSIKQSIQNRQTRFQNSIKHGQHQLTKGIQIQSPCFQQQNVAKFISSPIEGRALLNKLIFPNRSKMVASLIDLKKGNQTDRSSNKMRLSLLKHSDTPKVFNVKQKMDSLETYRFCQISLLNQQIKRSPRTLSINGTQFQFLSRNSSQK